MDKIKCFFKNNWSSIFKPVIVLLAICIIIPLALAATNMITHERIAELEVEAQNKAMALLYPDASFEEKSITKDDNTVEYYTARLDDKLIGYIFTTSAKGYGGNDSVSVMTAINTDGTIKAVKILDVSSETPGLGQNAAKESFYSQFSEMNGMISTNKTNADKSKNEMKPLAGATITSNAVKDAVNQAFNSYIEVADYPAETITQTEEVTENEK